MSSVTPLEALCFGDFPFYQAFGQIPLNQPMQSTVKAYEAAYAGKQQNVRNLIASSGFGTVAR